MRHQWQNNASLIQEITVTGNNKKTLREAVIVPSASQRDNPKLKELDDILINNGYNVSYGVQDGEPILRVTGIRTEKDLLSLIQKEEMVVGNRQTAKSETGSQSAWAEVKDNSLVLSAVFYMLGNIATMISGYFRRDADEFRTGLSFSIGDSTMLLFGKLNNQEKHQAVMQGFGDFLLNHGYAPDVGSGFAASAVKTAPSSWGKVKGFMHKLVIPIKSVSEIVAGASFAKAGINQENTYKKIAGSALVTGFSLGLAIPEKNDSQIRDELGVDTPEQAKTAQANLPWSTRAKYAIQKQPLIISGGFAAINNFATIFGAFDERKYSRNLRKLEAELGIDKEQNRLKTKGSSYDISVAGFTQTKQVDETAYAAYDRIKNTIDKASSESERLETQPKLLKASERVEKLKTEYKNATQGRHGLKGDKFWTFNLFQGLFFLAANTLYGMSSKSGSGSHALTERYVDAVASEMVKNPDPVAQHDILTLAAQYGGNLEEMDFTKAEMRKMIEERVEQLQTNPWVKKYNQTAPEKLLVEVNPSELSEDKQQEFTRRFAKADAEKDFAARITSAAEAAPVTQQI